MTYRNENAARSSGNKKKPRRAAQKGYNPYAGGMDVNSIRNMDGSGNFSSGFGGLLDNIVGNATDAIGGAANRAQALANPQRIAPTTTIQAKPKGRSAPKSGQGDPGYLDQLMQSMITDAASQTFDYESALKQSEQAIRQAYAAEIGAIRSNNGAARKDTKNARRQIEAMYNGLARTYGRDAQDATAQGTKDAAAMMGLANDANATIKNNQQDVSNSEMKMLSDLGIQDAAKNSDIITGDFERTKKTTAENTQHGQRKASSAKEMQAANAQYFQRSAGGAQFEGAGRSADLLAQLQDYIRGNRNQIAQLKGKRATDIASNKSSVMQAEDDARAKNDAHLWQMVQDAANLKIKTEDTNNDNNLASQKFKYQQQNDAANRALKLQGGSNSNLPKNLQRAMGLIQSNGQQKKKLTSILNGLFNTDPFVNGSTTQYGKNGKSVTHKMTPFAAAKMAEQAGRKAGLSEVDIQTLRLAAMASTGN